MITIDGAQGEGGGQVLRTALSLSMITGAPFVIDNIRAKRPRPGLLRQHLTCVKAAQQITAAKVTGGEIGSKRLTFAPGPIRGGDFTFAIGSAGSTTLVFQTVLPALLHADGQSRVTFTGGTHNPFAPSFDYLDRVFAPLLARMGVPLALTLQQPGFYPAGGGVWTATVTPARLTRLVLEDSGARISQSVRADVANLPYDIAAREVAACIALLGWPPTAGSARTVHAEGHGNVLAIELVHEHVVEMFTGFGDRKLSVEAVTAEVVGEVRDYLASGVPVGPHLADQVLLPMALAGGGSFVTMAPTGHTRTNMAVIERFLPVRFEVLEREPGRWRIAISPN